MGRLQDQERDESWERLLERARADDPGAISELYQRLRDYLVAIAHNGVPRPIQGKVGESDVVQEALFDAHSGFPKFRGESEGQFRNWLKTIFQSNLIDSVRKYKDAQSRDVSREVSLADADGRSRVDLISENGETPSRIVSRAELDHQLQAAISALPTNEQITIRLRHRDGLGFAEIGRRIDVTEATARRIWQRALGRLRARLATSREP